MAPLRLMPLGRLPEPARFHLNCRLSLVINATAKGCRPTPPAPGKTQETCCPKRHTCDFCRCASRCRIPNRDGPRTFRLHPRCDGQLNSKSDTLLRCQSLRPMLSRGSSAYCRYDRPSAGQRQREHRACLMSLGRPCSGPCRAALLRMRRGAVIRGPFAAIPIRLRSGFLQTSFRLAPQPGRMKRAVLR